MVCPIFVFPLPVLKEIKYYLAGTLLGSAENKRANLKRMLMRDFQPSEESGSSNLEDQARVVAAMEPEILLRVGIHQQKMLGVLWTCDPMHVQEGITSPISKPSKLPQG